ncbi:MAG: NAD-dependent epimerase/dehydratase family protein [Natronosporangium sp.]
MRLLILGGTRFLGRAVARLAHAAGHDVTCLARGEGGEPVEGVRFVPADRDAPDWLSTLDGDRFDAAVDVTRRPSHSRRAVEALADRVGHWSFVSSVSVYADFATPGQLAGTAPRLPPAPPEVDDPTGEHLEYYGGCKVSCEQAVLDRFGPDRSFLCRAGLIVGPEDPSGRFTYWVDRLARGGRVLAPGDPAEPVQLIDVRDLAGWLVRAAEQGLTGSYDATSAPVPRGRCLAEVAAGVGSPATLTWVDQAFLQAQEVQPWSGERSVPLWVPLPEYAGFMTHDVGPALAAGLTIRPLADTAAATLDWLRTDPGAAPATGLTGAEETELLRQWDAAAG